MLILLTIFLFIFTSLAMLLLHLVRPRFSIQGFLAVLALLAGMVMLSISRSEIPTTITLLNWEPKSLFPVSPSLILDDTSWIFAMALVALSFGVLIISISSLGQSSQQAQPLAENSEHEPEELTSSGETKPESPSSEYHASQMPNWMVWIVILIFTSIGLVAVTAGNLLTLVIAWAALDMLKLITLVSQTPKSQTRERVIVSFSANMAALVMVIVAGMMLWAKGKPVEFNDLPPSVSLLLLLAAGLRLGVLPPLLPFNYQLDIRGELETILQMIPASASFILLVRVAATGITGPVFPYLLAFTVLVGLYASYKWSTVPDVASGKMYWVLGVASLAISAAILTQPTASLAWSIACLLSGSLVYSMSIRHRTLIPVIILALFSLSLLPFSPTWQGANLYQSLLDNDFSLFVVILFSILLILIQSLIFTGYFRLIVKGIYPAEQIKATHIERWVWFIYPFGLVLMVLTHLLIGLLILPDLHNLPLYSWIIGPLTLLVFALLIYLSKLITIPSPAVPARQTPNFWTKLFSLEWLYLLVWKLYHTFTRVFSLVSSILEGDGGLLWALVIFALIVIFLQK